MQFRLATFISAVALAAPALAQGLPYEGYANTVSCSGAAFGCRDGGAVCCALPTGYGYSAQFNGLPVATQGQGYTGNTCGTLLFAVFGPGTKCWSGGGSRATHINWFHSPQARRVIQAREAEATAANCTAPAYFKYENASGIEKRIKVPADEGAAQTIADLYIAGDLTALAAYEDY
ncbi:hypothetical protein Hypma_011103 [Hypsizygus marmoreus]|uniref:Secreted protein n=1 Tax=Hypsizygus marmoreus TaxID=39966 RepID=A0A369JRW5_HYPMA|nr:hypothetical protein Hypma_011103 [Hypsizygus marmoreus]